MSEQPPKFKSICIYHDADNDCYRIKIERYGATTPFNYDQVGGAIVIAESSAGANDHEFDEPLSGLETTIQGFESVFTLLCPTEPLTLLDRNKNAKPMGDHHPVKKGSVTIKFEEYQA